MTLISGEAKLTRNSSITLTRTVAFTMSAGVMLPSTASVLHYSRAKTRSISSRILATDTSLSSIALRAHRTRVESAGAKRRLTSVRTI